MRKPRYHGWSMGEEECLVYECINCGFLQQVRTKDYRSTEDIAERIAREKQDEGPFDTN